MKKVLITGGPVHAYLDDVKIITNRFKGGLMVDLVGEFVKHSEQDIEDDERIQITYICSKNARQPWWDEYLGGEGTPYCKVVHHNGIYDYMDKVLELAPQMDAVVLGAAVANLIPKNKIKGKFPSHNYKVGDTISLEFTIAPRVIDKIKEVAPRTHLFGFKLLSNVAHNELINTAYGVLLESRATAVFANDAKNISQRYAVTKEKGVHPLSNNQELAQWIIEMINDEYYRTITGPYSEIDDFNEFTEVVDRFKKVIHVIEKFKSYFTKVENNLLLGCVAVREKGERFITTGRGKDEASILSIVKKVDHDKKIVYTEGKNKATLNAPLLDQIFFHHPDVDHIVHHHEEYHDIPTLDYAPPGTVRDSIRPEIGKICTFNIKEHGCFLSFDEKERMII